LKHFYFPEKTFSNVTFLKILDTCRLKKKPLTYSQSIFWDGARRSR
jgi:hypothetical protein